MIAQVRATPAPFERQQRHHEPPEDTGVGHALAELLPAGVLAAAQVVQQEAHRDPSGHRALQGGEEDVGDLVPAHDVELDMDVVGGSVNSAGHGLVGGAGLGMNRHHLTADAGQPSEPAGQAQRSGQVGRGLGSLGQVGHGAGVVEGDLVDGVLLTATSAVDPRAANEQIERKSHQGQQEDEQQPGSRRRRAAVLRNRAQRGDLDEVLDNDPGGRQYRRQRHDRIMSCPPNEPREEAWARAGWPCAQALRRPAPVDLPGRALRNEVAYRFPFGSGSSFTETSEHIPLAVAQTRRPPVSGTPQYLTVATVQR